MATKMIKPIDRYTYRITWSQEDNEYVGLCTEFPSLSWLADTREGALLGILNLVTEVITDMQSNGEKAPPPIAIRRFSGKIMVRIPPSVHRDLTIQAAEAKISINRLVNSKLAPA